MDKLIYQFPPKPSDPAVHFAVDEDCVIETRNGHTVWQMRFCDIDRVHYSVRSSNAGLTRTFILYHGDDVRVIEQTAPTADDDVYNGFTALMKSIAARLETAQPEFRINVGLLPKTKIAMCAAFGFSFIVGAGILIAIVVANLGFDEFLAVGLPLIGLMLCGLGGMWVYWPWRQSKTVAAKTFLKRTGPKVQPPQSG